MLWVIINRVIRLTATPPIYSIWGIWKIILKTYLSLKSVLQLKKLAENIFIKCGGQMDLSVRDAIIENFGLYKTGCADVSTANLGLLLQQEPSFKILVYH